LAPEIAAKNSSSLRLPAEKPKALDPDLRDAEEKEV
jgi:hypothetical protein